MSFRVGELADGHVCSKCGKPINWGISTDKNDYCGECYGITLFDGTGIRCGCENKVCNGSHRMGDCPNTGEVSTTFLSKLCGFCVRFMPKEYLEDPDTEKGIHAIIFLQNVAGIDESRNEAKLGWSRMSEAEKAYTIRVYEVFDK